MNDEILTRVLAENGIQIEDVGAEWGPEYKGQYRFLHFVNDELVEIGELRPSIKDARDAAHQYFIRHIF